MSVEESTKDQTSLPPKMGMRFWLGAFFIVISIICPVFIPLVRMINMPEGLKDLLTGGLVVGIPQLFTFASIVTLGKTGFLYIRNKLFGLFKVVLPPQKVSRLRYHIGLVMFILPIFFGWVIPYIDDQLTIYQNNKLIIGIIGDLIFVSSFFVLGGDFWDKLRSLFIYQDKNK